jgi:hypothetical protein
MKRSLLDITNVLSRNVHKVTLEPYDLEDSNYFIFIAKNWRFAESLSELPVRNSENRLMVTINTQYISSKDYLTEISSGGLLIKFKKSNFPYILDSEDYIEIIGDLESYA